MTVDFSLLRRDAYGKLESPSMLLKTRYGKTLGPVSKYFNLKAEFKFNEVSSVSFDLPAWDHGVQTPFYDSVQAETFVQIDPFGLFILQGTKVKGDGIKEIKSCTAYSAEYELAGKQLSFGEGTYPFYNPVSPKESMLAIAIERSRGWKIGSVSPALYNRYRTFDRTEKKVLDFLLNDVQEKYGCIFSFDTYTRTVNVIDRDQAAAMLPIYLSYNNLLKEVNVAQRTDHYATRVTVSGADGVDIRNVNPTGTNEIIHLGNAISSGELPEALAEKYYDWKRAILAEQAYYTSLVASRNVTYARYLTEKARLTDQEGELTSLDNLRAVNVQGRAMATEYGSEAQEGTVAYFDARLREIATEYSAKQEEIKAQKSLLEEIEARYNAVGKDIAAVNARLKFENYFTGEELDILDGYLVDGAFSDSSFAVFDVDISGSKDSFNKEERATLTLKDTAALDVNTAGGNGSRILVLSGGTLEAAGKDYSLSAPIISGTLEVFGGNDMVFSAYLGSGSANGKSFPSGNLSCVCSSPPDVDALLAGMERIVETTTDQETGVTREEISYRGGGVIEAKDCAIYFTRNVTEYQRYSVEQDLYEYAEKRMEEIAYPVFEFEVDSGNFIWAHGFEPFKDALRLGSAVYLKLNENTMLKPVLLEVHLDFERPDNFTLVFSSQFQTKRPDKVNKLKEIITEAGNTSRTLDFERLKYRGQDISGAAAALDRFMKDGLNSAYQQVTAGLEQEVRINGAGIKVGTRGKNEFIYLSNGMISIVDDAAKSSKMAMGHFYSQEYGQDYYGIIADVIVGTLVAGHGFSFACEDINDGSMLFEANSKGVQLHNSRFYLDHDRGGQIVLDPVYGFAIGTKELYTFDENGRAVLNYDNANAYINMDGRLVIQDGISKGDFYANNFYFNDGESVKTLLDQAAKKFDLSGLDYIDLGGIQLDGDTGDITMSGNLNLSGLSSINFGSNTFVKTKYSTNKNAAIPGGWLDTWNSGWSGANIEVYEIKSYDNGKTWVGPNRVQSLNGTNGSNGSDATVNYDNIKSALQKAASLPSAFMTVDALGAPNIYGGKIYGAEMYANEFNVYPLDKDGDIDYFGEFNIFGHVIHARPEETYHMFQIRYDGGGSGPGGSPFVEIGSPRGAIVKPINRWDFTDTTVVGLIGTFG